MLWEMVVVGPQNQGHQSLTKLANYPSVCQSSWAAETTTLQATCSRKGGQESLGSLRSTTVSAVTGYLLRHQHLHQRSVLLSKNISPALMIGRSDWWFVLRKEEATLQRLEVASQQIAIQTEWKLA